MNESGYIVSDQALLDVFQAVQRRESDRLAEPFPSFSPGLRAVADLAIAAFKASEYDSLAKGGQAIADAIDRVTTTIKEGM